MFIMLRSPRALKVLLIESFFFNVHRVRKFLRRRHALEFTYLILSLIMR